MESGAFQLGYMAGKYTIWIAILLLLIVSLVKVCTAPKGKNKQFLYRYFLPKPQLRATSGAPVVNAEGEVVAMNLGGWTGKFTYGIGNGVEGIRSLLASVRNPRSKGVPEETK